MIGECLSCCKRTYRRKIIPKELSADWSSLHNAASESLILHQWRRIHQSVFLDEFTRDSRRHTGAVWWNEKPHAGMTAATHSTTSRVNHETYQETAKTHHSNNLL